MRHLLTLADLSAAYIERIFAISKDLKSKYESGVREPLLPGRVMALLFEKPSLRTRVSFEAAMSHLGGNSMFLGSDVGWGTREPVHDFGRVLSQYVDVLVVRAFDHRRVEELAAHCNVPIINGLTDKAHPCQALADIFTLRELLGDDARGAKLAYVGDCNNVARSLAVGCAKLGIELAIAAPENYRFAADFLPKLLAENSGAKLSVSDDPVAVVKDAAAVYTDVWTSMGQEAESAQRVKDFAGYQVNEKLLQHAPDAYFLHCLPARRDEEVAASVIDGHASAVIQQAGNRMHVQKGILAWLLTVGN